MFGTHDLLLFAVSGMLLNITPGPDTLYIVGRATQSLRAGVIAAFGIGAGALVHITAAAFGLSAILAASATAFSIVKWAGAAYLVYVGVSLLRSAASAPGPDRATPLVAASSRAVFLQGFLTNVLNPKVALFFLAFLPQFVDHDAHSRVLAFLFLGVIFNVNGTVWNLLVAWSAARLTGGLRRRSMFARGFNGCVGGLFVCLGIRLALATER
jgi:threonine/homoserine/homoserine lactone efflux protein